LASTIALWLCFEEYGGGALNKDSHKLLLTVPALVEDQV